MSKQRHLPDMLVSTDWLQANLQNEHIAVVDIRGYVNAVDLGGGRQQAEYLGAPDEYLESHIPGSVFVDWTSDIVDRNDPIPAQVAPPKQFAEAMSRRGIGDETGVVVVDHSGGHFATRLWWALRHYGHDDVAVLDGGFNKWLRESRPLTASEEFPTQAVFTPVERAAICADREEVRSAIDAENVMIVDARDRETYTGQVFRGSRAGHIPSAINVPAKSLFDPDGIWKSAEELDDLLNESGLGDHRVLAYCNGGVTATAILFALARTGHDDFANYDGSWNDWGERPEFPVEIGD